MAMLIRTNGTLDFVQPENNRDFKLEEFYTILSCTMIEVLNLKKPGFIMIINDDERYKDDPKPNVNATAIYMRGRLPFLEGVEQLKMMHPGLTIFAIEMVDADVIVGDVIICRRSELK